MMLPRGMNAAVVCLALSTLVGCATVKTMPVKYSDPDKPSVVDTVEAESNDVRLACVSMVKKMLDNPLLASQEKAPHIIVDADYFRNESSSRLNKNMLTDLLRSELLNAAGGRLIFVGREYEEMVNDERNRKDEGTESPGTTPRAPRPIGADYRLGGRITDLTNTGNMTGLIERYTQIVFEVVDLETGQIIMSDSYSFRKEGQLNVVYR